MPPKTKGKPAATKGLPKPKRYMATTDNNDFLGQTFEQENKRCTVFIEKLIERLTYFGEDDKTLHDAFTNNIDLPPPKLKKAAATGSQPENVDESSRLTKELGALQKKLEDKDKEITDLKEEKQSLESKFAQCEKEKEYLGNRNKELDMQVQKYKHKSEKQKTYANNPSVQPRSPKHVPPTDSENDIDTLKTNLQRHQYELKKLREDKDKEITDLKEENQSLESKLEKKIEEEQLQREKSDVTKDYEKQREAFKTLQEENAELKAEIEKKTKDAEKLQTETSDLNKGRGKRVEQLQREKSDLTKDNEKLKETLKTLNQENAEQKAELEKTTKAVEKLQREKSSLTNEKEKHREKIPELQRENKDLHADNEKKRKEIEQLQKDKSDHTRDSQGKKKGGGKGEKTSSADTISKLHDEIDGLRNRLSKMAGAQLTDNNPAIADLSDPNRPLSLGEKFSELYDNEWTDAMEEMADRISDETKVIKLLLDIVCDAYKFCLDKSDTFMDKINNTLSGFSEEFSSSETMPKEIAKTNKDYRKSLAVYVVSFLQQDFAKEAKAKADTKVGTKTEAYMKRCVFVCWFMTVQDPKVCITMKPSEMFDEDLYKPYTKKGKRLDYVVWPVLRLHEGGPTIGKGVAQGKP
ncbi:girdin-like isoform X2 [Mizuhopecten yessoensis]|uniref:girdin-like isoform X2 n=1 Tax=Mizuhopecten yessoensis TaxID=6573 RepID=UPI000B45857C|nr:girdin-like isoform X2 [Mizuhopecten yessoensis]